MTNDTLSQAIDAFLCRKVHPGGNRKYIQAKGIFDQSEQASRQTYGLKQQAALAEWLDQPLTGPSSDKLARALELAIGDSIMAYTRKKQLMCDLYQSFCSFLEESYGLHVPIDWDDYNVLSNNREWQIIQMSTENKSISEMSVQLMVSERQIRDDIENLNKNGLTFLDRKIKITGMKRVYGGIQFESTPHPILLLGNLMQVISILEALRHYQEISKSDVPKTTASEIWKNLSPYARTTIKKRIRDQVYESDYNWYEGLDRSQTVQEQDTFLTESAIVASNVRDQLIKCLKNGELCTIHYHDENGVKHILKSFRIGKLSAESIHLQNQESGQQIKLRISQVISCTQQKK